MSLDRYVAIVFPNETKTILFRSNFELLYNI